MNYEKKQIDFDVKQIDDEQREFEGYASVFGNRDSHGDIVEKGAFRKTIQERGDQLKILWQHDMTEPIGKVVEAREDDHGLKIRGKLSNTTRAKDALQLMKDGVVNQLSIGFDTIKEDFKDGIRHLKELKLYEVSPVTFPSNELAYVTDVKKDESQQGGIERALKRISSVKEGRVLSEHNQELLQEAMEAIESLLSQVEPSDDTQQEEEAEEDSSEIEDKPCPGDEEKPGHYEEEEKLSDEVKELAKEVRLRKQIAELKQEINKTKEEL